MRILDIKASKNYCVNIGDNLFEHCAELLLEVKAPCELMVVSDDTVYSHYGNMVSVALKSKGFFVNKYVFPHGERSKTVNELENILEALCKAKITRKGLIVALGGGVVGDVAGFAAAVYQRGIDYVQMPTTLLAAVDSSIGGKTAVNLRAGKNLMGAFHQPISVICDTKAFSTLPDDIYTDGIGEMLKYAFIACPGLLTKLSSGRHELDDIAKCVDIKRELVEADEYDNGVRALLNFGHTAGHAIEYLSEFRISHGHAVALGMLIMTRYAEKSGICVPGASEQLEEAMLYHKMPVDIEFCGKELAEAAKNDKKKDSAEIAIILPRDIGNCFIKKVSSSSLEQIFSEGLKR